MSSKPTSNLSPFMQEQLQFRSDLTKIADCTESRELNSRKDKFKDPSVFWPVTILTGLFFVPYVALRGQGVAIELVKKRNPIYRFKLAALGTTSFFFFGMTLWYIENNYYKYRRPYFN